MQTRFQILTRVFRQSVPPTDGALDDRGGSPRRGVISLEREIRRPTSDSASFPTTSCKGRPSESEIAA